MLLNAAKFQYVGFLQCMHTINNQIGNLCLNLFSFMSELDALFASSKLLYLYIKLFTEKVCSYG